MKADLGSCAPCNQAQPENAIPRPFPNRPVTVTNAPGRWSYQHIYKELAKHNGGFMNYISVLVQSAKPVQIVTPRNTH